MIYNTMDDFVCLCCKWQGALWELEDREGEIDSFVLCPNCGSDTDIVDTDELTPEQRTQLGY